MHNNELEGLICWCICRVNLYGH